MKNNGKKRRKLIFILLIVFVTLTGGYAAYANKDLLINRYYLITKTPSEYYTYIEQFGLYRLMSAIPEETATEEAGYAYDISSKLTFHHKALDSVLDTALGTNLTDLENTLGIPFESVGIKVLLASKAQMLSNSVGISLNDTNLLTSNLFFDAVNDKLFLRFPELSEVYLTKSLREGSFSPDIDEAQLKLQNKERIHRIVNRYMKLYFSHLGDVTLKRNVPLSLETLETEANLLTVSYTREELKKLYHSIFATAKSDEDILALLPSLYITKEQYLQALEKAEQLLNEHFEKTPSETTLQMKLYLNNEGHLLSRELIDFEQSSLGYTLLEKMGYREYEIHLLHEPTKHQLRINGKNRKLEAANNGNMTLLLHAPSITASPDLNLDVTYEDIQSIVLEDKRYLEGSFTLSADKLAGIQITSEFAVDKDGQQNTTEIRQGTAPLVTISSSCRSPVENPLTLPENTSTQFDYSQYEEYLNTMDAEGYLNKLTDTLGIDPDTLSKLISNISLQ